MGVRGIPTCSKMLRDGLRDQGLFSWVVGKSLQHALRTVLLYSYQRSASLAETT